MIESDPKYIYRKYNDRYLENVSRISGVERETVEKVLLAYSEFFLHELAISSSRPEVDLCFPMIGRIIIAPQDFANKRNNVKIKVKPSSEALSKICDAYYDRKDILIDRITKDYKRKIGDIVLSSTFLEGGDSNE